MTSDCPKVSVAVITYNHERFIAQAIESILQQEVDFAYEVVIGEDRSTDGTRAIVVDYARRYPHRIRPLLHEHNVGMISNVVMTLEACRGKYVALLEGDDYWTTGGKLQRQVDFLDRHPECSQCFHNALVVYSDSGQENGVFFPPGRQMILTLPDLLVTVFPTCSTMYRRGLFAGFPEWLYSLAMVDVPLHVLNAEHGYIGYLDAVMAAYRIHGGGAWSGLAKSRQLLATIKMYRTLDAHLGFKYRGIFRRLISWRLHRLALEYERMGARTEARAAVLQSLVTCPLNDYVSGRERCDLLFRVGHPALYDLAKRSWRMLRPPADG